RAAEEKLPQSPSVLQPKRQIGPSRPSADDASGAAGPPATRQPGATELPDPPLFPGRPAAIGPALPEGKRSSASKRPLPRSDVTLGPASASSASASRPAKQARGSGQARSSSRTGPLDLTGEWLVRVKSPPTEFLYSFQQQSDNSVSGRGAISGTGYLGRSLQDLAEASKVTGRVQGYVVTWTEETGGKFRANISTDGQGFDGTGQINETVSENLSWKTRISFEASRCQPLPAGNSAGSEIDVLDLLGSDCLALQLKRSSFAALSLSLSHIRVRWNQKPRVGRAALAAVIAASIHYLRLGGGP
ncbi:unnamed protein product, partial [Polarella glacialis]